MYSDLRADISLKCSNYSHVMIIGDLYAHTSNLPDYEVLNPFILEEMSENDDVLFKFYELC